MKHATWQDYVNTVLGISLSLSPAVLGYVDQRQATTNAVVVGALLAATAFRAAFASRGWEHGLATATALWLAVSPWALGFHTSLLAMPTALAVGLLSAALSQWALLDRTLAVLRPRSQRRSARLRAESGVGARRADAAHPRRPARARRRHP